MLIDSDNDGILDKWMEYNSLKTARYNHESILFNNGLENFIYVIGGQTEILTNLLNPETILDSVELFNDRNTRASLTDFYIFNEIPDDKNSLTIMVPTIAGGLNKTITIEFRDVLTDNSNFDYRILVEINKYSFEEMSIRLREA